MRCHGVSFYLVADTQLYKSLFFVGPSVRCVFGLVYMFFLPVAIYSTVFSRVNHSLRQFDGVVIVD